MEDLPRCQKTRMLTSISDKLFSEESTSFNASAMTSIVYVAEKVDYSSNLEHLEEMPFTRFSDFMENQS